jgi:hypothetical protein
MPIGDSGTRQQKARLTEGGLTLKDQGFMMSCIGEASLSILIPTEEEQRTQRYSYWSPSGRTKSNLFLTGTATLHLGQ